ncbi:MAG TPA: hypothetical protein VFQ30_16375, partial [Ktedonobacteraceae bacterium]|nr:hypothetical protein [Ktedonobacteraceae bacterium]
EAATSIRRALGVARAMHNAPCLGMALLALANLRIAQARALPQKHLDTRTRLLAHARQDIQRALTLPGLEAETHTRSLLTLTEIASLLEETDAAKTLAQQTIEEAQRYELVSVEQAARKLL